MSITSTGSQVKIASGTYEEVVNFIMLGSIEPMAIKSVGWDVPSGSVAVLYFR